MKIINICNTGAKNFVVCQNIDFCLFISDVICFLHILFGKFKINKLPYYYLNISTDHFKCFVGCFQPMSHDLFTAVFGLHKSIKVHLT